MTVWVVASLAFAVLAWLVLGLFAAQPTSETEPARPTE
jgi:hypothetical protein